MQRQQRIGAKVGVSRLLAVITVLADGSPSGKQWPNGAKVVSGWIVNGLPIGKDTHAPIARMIWAGERSEGLIGTAFFNRSKPHGDRGQHRFGLDLASALTQSEDIALAL